MALDGVGRIMVAKRSATMVLNGTAKHRHEGKYLGKIKFTFCMHSARYSHEEV
jgi:hypothetical protein